jgi:hypothetical protein
MAAPIFSGFDDYKDYTRSTTGLTETHWYQLFCIFMKYRNAASIVAPQ